MFVNWNENGWSNATKYSRVLITESPVLAQVVGSVSRHVNYDSDQ